jgi:membrane-associated phospholipid phosphatase
VGGAGGSIVGTLGDVYANPVMIDALIHSREGTIIVPEILPNNYQCYEPSPTTIDDPRQMKRWEPWVRAYLGVGEMLQGITFQSPPGTNAFQVWSSSNLIAEIQRPAQATFEQQIPLVISWAQLRNERATEILAEIDPQYAFWSSIVYLHPERTRHTLELINMVLQFCVYVEMRFKHAFGCYRPVEYNAEVQPMITTPGHGSFPMGHATQTYAVTYVLRRLLQLDASSNFQWVIDQLDRLSARITTNRVIAGVHFPADSMAGRMLGVALGEYFVGRCTGNQTFMSRKFFAATGIDDFPTTDFNPFHTAASTSTVPSQDLGQGPLYALSSGTNVTQSPLMSYLWDKAQYEWIGRFGVPIPP